MIGAIQTFFNRLMKERDEAHRAAFVIRRGLRNLYKSQLPRMAAAMAYRTIFSIVPVLVVAVAVIGQFTSEDELDDRIDQLIVYFGLDTIEISDPDADSEAAESPAADADTDAGVLFNLDAGEQADEEGPAERDNGGSNSGGGDSQQNTEDSEPTGLGDVLKDTVGGVITDVPLQAIGIVGLLVFIYAALSMLVELERSFNQIYRTTVGRNWTRRIAIYWTTLTLGSIFLFGTFSLGGQVATWATNAGIANIVGANAIRFAINAFINMSLLLLAYTAVPNARVHIRSALVGAVASAILWEGAKWGFTQYVLFSTRNLERLYGVVALLPLFMLWVYLTWIIVLFGLQVAHSLQTFREWSAEDDADGPRVLAPSAALVVGAVIGRRFGEGEPTSIEQAADLSGLDEDAAGMILNGLVSAGIAHRLSEDDETERFALARPPERIAAAEVMAVGRTLVRRAGTGRGSEPTHAAILALERAETGALAGRTLADFIGEATPASGTDDPADGASD